MNGENTSKSVSVNAGFLMPVKIITGRLHSGRIWQSGKKFREESH